MLRRIKQGISYPLKYNNKGKKEIKPKIPYFSQIKNKNKTYNSSDNHIRKKEQQQ
jgi:hypothetical protein